MTNPGGSSGLQPGQWGVTGTDGSIPSKSAQTQDSVTAALQNQFSSNQFAGLGGGLIAMILSFITAGLASVLGGFANIIEAISGTVNNAYVEQLPVITDHSHSITTLQEQFDQLILQGEAIVFTSNNSYTPTPGIKSIDVIIIGAGGGGSSGSYDALFGNSTTGGGGGGGGETHTSVPASLLPVDGSGNFLPIQIIIGAGGAGASGDAHVGAGGGHSKFGPEVGNGGTQWLLGGGGDGGAFGTPAPTAAGGVGMIPGGTGGRGVYYSGQLLAPTPGGNSTSAYDLHGGGGGGGAGAYGTQIAGTAGGGGGISPGGAVGTPGAPGSSPASIIATGAGGGGGGACIGSTAYGGGAGGYPAGGGGGSATYVGGATTGGLGGNGICYVIERSA